MGQANTHDRWFDGIDPEQCAVAYSGGYTAARDHKSDHGQN